MNTKLQIVLIISCVIFFGFVSASNDKIRSQSTGTSLKEPRDFIAKQTVVSIITPTGSLIIDCRHENPKTHVSLLFTRVLDKSFLDITKKENIVQLGQVFMLNEVNIDDDGYYMCARKDGNGKRKVVAEVFVMEEENIYSGFSGLKHAFEDQAIEEMEPFVKPSDNDRTSINGPSDTDNKQDMMEIAQQQNVTISQDIAGSTNQIVLDHVASFRSETSSHVSSFTQDHLTTQIVLDHVTSFCNETACHVSSTSHNGLDDLIPVTNMTSGHVSYIAQIALDHVTAVTNQTSGHMSYIAQIALDHVTAVTKVTSIHVSSITSFVMEWVRYSSAAFMVAIAMFLNNTS